MNADRLVAAQPGLSLTDPVVSILWGVFAFHERVRGGWFIALAVVSGLVMSAAVLVLGRSPLLAGESGSSQRPGRGRPQQEGARARLDAASGGGRCRGRGRERTTGAARGRPGAE